MSQIGTIGDPRTSDPAHHAVAVVPSNTNDLPSASTVLYVEVSGAMNQIGTIGDPRSSDPAHHAVAVVPSDTNDLPAASTSLYVGVSGNLKVTMLGGEILTFSNLPVGWHPIRVTRVWTSTTATNIIAGWR